MGKYQIRFQRFCTGAHSLVSYLDSRSGDNKNLMFLALLSDLHFANKYQTMEHIYLEHHTYLKNDHNFAIIEKRKKAAEVYIPSN